MFPETGSREPYKTVCFGELALFYPCDESYRKSAGKLNRVLWRKEGQEVRARPLANLVEREGEQIQASLERKAKCVLEDHGFNTNGSIIDQQKMFESIKEEEVILAREKVCQAIEELNRG